MNRYASVGHEGEDFFRKWKAVIERAEKCPVGKWMREVESLHKDRGVHEYLTGGSPTAKRAIGVASTDLGARSRIVQLRVRSFRVKSRVIAANDACRSLLLDRGYCAGKTQADRNAKADVIMERGVTIRSRLESFDRMADMIIDDIDRAHWSMKMILESMSQASKPELVL